MRILGLLCLMVAVVGVAGAQEGRDPWSRLERYDSDRDGKVTREEFRGPDRVFERLDADADGAITREEARAMRGRMRGGGAGGAAGGRMPGGGTGGRTGGRGGGGGTDRLVRSLDADGDGAVSAEEWMAFFKKADENGDEFLQPEELTAALRGTALRDDAPQVGAPAPKVEATRASDGKKVDLSTVRRPTVLVFGSWT